MACGVSLCSSKRYTGGDDSEHHATVSTSREAEAKSFGQKTAGVLFAHRKQNVRSHYKSVDSRGIGLDVCPATVPVLRLLQQSHRLRQSSASIIGTVE